MARRESGGDPAEGIAKTMSTAMGIQDFLGHQTRGAGGAKFLKSWRGRQPPEIDIWLHTKAPIYSVWQHTWPKIQVIERDGRKTREVWGGTFVSWEDEEVNRGQRNRQSDGSRVIPAVICPMARLIDRIYMAIETGELKWTTALFEFKGDDPTKNRTLHAGGIVGMFGQNDLDDAARRELRKAGIKQSEAWKENCMSKCNYIFTVVEQGRAEDGIQLTTETTLLGDKMKELIAAQQESEGDDAGNPLRHPYAIRWKHLPNEKEFHKRYTATRINKHKLSKEIRALIIDTNPPDATPMYKRGSAAELRLSVETHYCGPEGLLDLDDIFGAAEASESGSDELATVGTTSSRHKDVEEIEEELADGDQYECDNCHEMMPMTASVCPHCGTEYEDDSAGDDEPEDEEPEAEEDQEPEVEDEEVEDEEVEEDEDEDEEAEEAEDEAEDEEDEEDDEPEPAPRRSKKVASKTAGKGAKAATTAPSKTSAKASPGKRSSKVNF